MIGSKTWHPAILKERAGIAVHILWYTYGPMTSERQKVAMVVSNVASFPWAKELNIHGFAEACGAVADELDRLNQIMEYAKTGSYCPPDLVRLAEEIWNDPEIMAAREGEIGRSFRQVLSAAGIDTSKPYPPLYPES